METQQISFEHLPRLVYELSWKVDYLTNLITSRAEANAPDRWLSIDEFIKYHPAKPAKTTVYSWVQDGLVPYVRQGKALIFRQSEIDAWLAGKATATAASVALLTESHLSSVVRRPRRKSARRA